MKPPKRAPTAARVAATAIPPMAPPDKCDPESSVFGVEVSLAGSVDSLVGLVVGSEVAGEDVAGEEVLAWVDDDEGCVDSAAALTRSL